MTRLIVFLGFLTALVLTLTLSSFRHETVSNEKFSFEKAQEEHKAVAELIAKAQESHEVEAVVETQEVKVPEVELTTPELKQGFEVYNKIGNCAVCHGKAGEGKKSQKAPKLGGQYPWYLEKQLSDMKSKARPNPAMESYLAKLSDADFKAVAQYISKLPW